MKRTRYALHRLSCHTSGGFSGEGQRYTGAGRRHRPVGRYVTRKRNLFSGEGSYSQQARQRMKPVYDRFLPFLECLRGTVELKMNARSADLLTGDGGTDHSPAGMLLLTQVSFLLGDTRARSPAPPPHWRTTGWNVEATVYGLSSYLKVDRNNYRD